MPLIILTADLISVRRFQNIPRQSIQRSYRWIFRFLAGRVYGLIVGEFIWDVETGLPAVGSAPMAVRQTRYE